MLTRASGEKVFSPFASLIFARVSRVCFLPFIGAIAPAKMFVRLTLSLLSRLWCNDWSAIRFTYLNTLFW
jgi:hypothetical protein